MARVRLRDGLSLHVEEAGRGATLLLVHGFTGSGAAWPQQVIELLSRHFRLLAVDLLGHGSSDKPEDPARYALEQVVCDLCEVLDGHQSSRALWVGYSMGGRVALAAALRHPERVRGLVLESASPGLADTAARRERTASDEALASRLEQQGIEHFVDNWMQLPLFRTQLRLPHETRERERKRRLQNSAPALAACLRGLGTGVQPSLWMRLAEATAPTLLVVGEWDAKFRRIAERMGRELPNASLALLPQAGHASHLENPRDYAECVRRFCARVTQDTHQEGEHGHEGRMEASR